MDCFVLRNGHQKAMILIIGCGGYRQKGCLTEAALLGGIGKKTATYDESTRWLIRPKCM